MDTIDERIQGAAQLNAAKHGDCIEIMLQSELRKVIYIGRTGDCTNKNTRISFLVPPNEDYSHTPSNLCVMNCEMKEVEFPLEIKSPRFKMHARQGTETYDLLLSLYNSFLRTRY